jgi:hypothetical protein
MVQSTQHILAAHSVTWRKSMSMLGMGQGKSKRGRYARSQAHMNSVMVEMQDPTVE